VLILKEQKQFKIQNDIKDFGFSTALLANAPGAYALQGAAALNLFFGNLQH
jgi:hypothetical protein